MIERSTLQLAFKNMVTLEDVKVLGIGSALFAEMEDDAVDGDVAGDDADEDEEEEDDEDGEDAE